MLQPREPIRPGGPPSAPSTFATVPVELPRPPDRLPASARFLGIQFQIDDLLAVMARIEARKPMSAFEYVVTPNVDHLIRLGNMRSDLWPAYRQAWLTLCDSRILRHLARWADVRLSIVPGSDLTEAVFGRLLRRDDRIAIVGGSAEAIQQLRDRYDLDNVIHHNPPMGFVNDPVAFAQAVRFIDKTRARYTILAVGSPQQEILAYRVKRLGTSVGIGLCVGASLDFLTGRQSRAPRLMQRLSLEWLYRLLANPGRMWRRYLVDGPLIFALYRKWCRRRAED